MKGMETDGDSWDLTWQMDWVLLMCEWELPDFQGCTIVIQAKARVYRHFNWCCWHSWEGPSNFQWQQGESTWYYFCNPSINLEIFQRKRSIKRSRNQGKKHKGGRISIPTSPKQHTHQQLVEVHSFQSMSSSDITEQGDRGPPFSLTDILHKISCLPVKSHSVTNVLRMSFQCQFYH